VPGEGALELDPFATTLLERGYDSIVSVEVLSSALRGQPVDVLVGRLHDTAAPFWTGRGRGVSSHANERDAGRHAR
jgi:sugar phosphate isomerase/epimerase